MLLSLEWLAELITDSKSAIEHKDSENYKIIGHSLLIINESIGGMTFPRDLKFNF